MGYNKSMKYAFLLIFIFISPVAFSSPAEEKEEFRINMLDRVQELFGARFNFAANRLDSFFATDRADDELGRSRVRIRTRYTMSEHYNGDHNTLYRINLKLPNLEDRFRYDYYQSDSKINKKEKKHISEEEAKKRLTGNQVNKGWIFNSDIGVSAAIPPRLTARARLRKSFETGTLIHRFVEQITFVTDESGFVHDTSLTSDQTLDERTLFRFINSVRWRISEKDFLTQSGPSILQQLTDNDAINYGAYVYSTVENSAWFMSSYQASIDYRRNLYRQWIYLDIIPGVDFPKYFRWDVNPFLIFQLEVLLGH